MNLSTPSHITDLIQKGALFFCSHSGGKDSQAMYAYLSRVVPHDQIVVVHANLPGVEWEGVEAHIKNTITHELSVVIAKKTFMEMVEKRGMFPSSQFRQCTSDLKTGPLYVFMRKVCKERGATLLVNCTGIRAEESGPRSKMIPFAENKELSKAGRSAWNWMPIFQWSTMDVFSSIKEAGQKPHWAYQAGMSRLSCCFCIMASHADLKVSAKHNPELLDQVAALEEKIGHTMFMHQSKPIAIKDYLAADIKPRKKKTTDCAGAA